MIEIKIYGTGGQGAVVAAKILADAAAKGGFHVQAFSAYGAERRGGKVESYVRLSRDPVSIHCKMYEPDYAVIMDESIAKDPGFNLKVRQGGGLLINSSQGPETFSHLGNVWIATVNANRIAVKNGVVLPNGMPIINTTILGAVVGMVPEIGITNLVEAIQQGKIPAADKNINAAREAYESVTSREAGEGAKEQQTVKIVGGLPAYRDRRPPCEANCSASHRIHKTISLIRENRFEEALENIRQENPFPGITGRVCFHPCESHCNVSDGVDAIAINSLERAAYDYADKSKAKKPAKKENTGKKVAVVGSGPAGMTCAYFLSILGHQVTVFESLPQVGGIPGVGIPAYRLPKEVVDAETAEIIRLGVHVKTSTRVGKDISFANILETHDACFIATGAHQSRSMDFPEKGNSHIFSGLEFLKKIALGEKIEIGKRVAVIGGGNTAVDAARSALRLGAEEVTIVYRRTAQEMPAYAKEVSAAKGEGIRIEYLAAPVALHNDGRQLGKLECIRTTMGELDSDGRPKPIRIEKSNFTINVDTVLTAIGELPDLSFLPESIEMAGALVEVDELNQTSIPGVFAGGDITNEAWNVSEAIGSGKRAAIGIDVYLKGEKGQEILESIGKSQGKAVSMEKYLRGESPVNEDGVITSSELNMRYLGKGPRIDLEKCSSARMDKDFDEVHLGFSMAEAVEEAKRCFHCGHCNLCGNCFIFCPDRAIAVDEATSLLVLNSSLCKGCGICINECPRGAMAWKGDRNG